MAISCSALMVLNVVFVFTVIGLTIARQWILRHRTKTMASVISDSSLILFTCVIVVIGSFEMKFSLDELRLRRLYDSEWEIFEHLVTESYMKISFACMILYTTQLFFLKLAYLGYFILLRPHVAKWTNWLLNGTIAYSAVGFVVALTVQLTLCLPIQRNWSTGPDVCVGLSTIAGSTVQAWLNLTADVLILILAIHTVSSLGMGKSERNALFVVIVLGCISPIMCLVRFVAVYRSAADPVSATPLSLLRNIYLYGKFEVCFGHIAFCLPSLRVFWRRRRLTASQKASASAGTGPVLSADKKYEFQSYLSEIERRPASQYLDSRSQSRNEDSRADSRNYWHGYGGDTLDALDEYTEHFVLSPAPPIAEEDDSTSEQRSELELASLHVSEPRMVPIRAHSPTVPWPLKLKDGGPNANYDDKV